MASDPSAIQIFPRTDWAELSKAAVADEARLDRLIRLYWVPLRIFFLVATFPALKDQADTLLQDFAEDKLLQEGWLRKADQNRGRFRDFLKTSLRNFVLNHLNRAEVKRPPISMEELEQELPESEAISEGDPGVAIAVTSPATPACAPHGTNMVTSKRPRCTAIKLGRRPQNADMTVDTETPAGPGVAGWNDFSGVSTAARESLRTASGIDIPDAGFVVRVLALICSCWCRSIGAFVASWGMSNGPGSLPHWSPWWGPCRWFGPRTRHRLCPRDQRGGCHRIASAIIRAPCHALYGVIRVADDAL